MTAEAIRTIIGIGKGGVGREPVELGPDSTVTIRRVPVRRKPQIVAESVSAEAARISVLSTGCPGLTPHHPTSPECDAVTSISNTVKKPTSTVAELVRCGLGTETPDGSQIHETPEARI